MNDPQSDYPPLTDPEHLPQRQNQAREILERVYGYDTFRGSQADIIEHVVNGEDALVLMPTGGG